MKICRKCKRELEKGSFHKHKGYKDGLNNVCKECRSKDNKKHYSEDKSYWQEYYKDLKKDPVRYRAWLDY